MTNRKQLGQYMSPKWIVNLILDNVGYTGEKILNKKIMEPSFGDGAFLVEIVSRLIYEGKKIRMNCEEISKIIEDNIYGIEKDSSLFSQTISRLNNLLKNENIPKVNWKNLVNANTLDIYENYIEKLDYCIGNPPFVRLHHMSEEDREKVKTFKFGTGITDLYIIFYEIGMKMLKKDGTLGFISPNSFLKNTSQKNFRKILIEEEYLSAMYDFKNSKVFSDADTYTCICILDKCKKKNVKYREYQMNQILKEYQIPYTKITDTIWNFGSEEEMKFLEKNKERCLKLKDIATVQNGIVTNRDEIYIHKIYEDEKLLSLYYGKKQDIVYFKYNQKIYSIESKILRRCVKASRYIGEIDNTYIIFPYQPEPLSEEELKKQFPKAYNYLRKNKEKLEKRDLRNTDWFLFGRSQGIKNSNQKKIIFKHIISRETPVVIPYILDEDIVVYGGIFTTSNDLKRVKNIFSSSEFAKYCSLVGKDKSGGFVEISTKMVKEFGIFIDNCQ